ncbi:MAG: acetylglutamate kinase [Acidobacteriota bacterium]|nr:acetylglutamate kinase [Acidobacteriota bacterium]MDQ7088714.1 acetylglutamate kinase [Acidobacteriota bacterium]
MSELVAALKGALDYTRLYRRQTFVLKIGGETLGDPRAVRNLAMQVALLDSLSIRLVVVHGGGPQATRLSRELGVPVEIVAGRRVTSPATLEVAKMVFAGQLNVELLAALRSQGVRGVGLSGVDANLITARRREKVTVKDDDGSRREVDYGEVGDVTAVDPTLIETLVARHYVPVVASLAATDEGRVLNVNADTIAERLAVALEAKKLIFLTSSPGLLRDVDDSSSLVTFASPEDLLEMLESGAISAGMRPKVEACLRAVKGGVKRTHIIDGRAEDSLLIELFTGAGAGTMIVGQREAESYREKEH